MLTNNPGVLFPLCSSIVQCQYRMSLVSTVFKQSRLGFIQYSKCSTQIREKVPDEPCIDSVDKQSGLEFIWYLKCSTNRYLKCSTQIREKVPDEPCIDSVDKQSGLGFIWYSKCSTQIREKTYRRCKPCIDSVDNPDWGDPVFEIFYSNHREKNMEDGRLFKYFMQSFHTS